MNQPMNLALASTLLGVTATIVLDLWALAREAVLRVSPPNYALVGRWIAHVSKGRFRHDSIAKATPVRHESLLGWAVHYTVGIAFASILLAIWGTEWLRNPTLLPALIVGVGSVAAPFLLLQPGMGLGIAASRAPQPQLARWRSFVMHTVFGMSLYIAGWILHLLRRALEHL